MTKTVAAAIAVAVALAAAGGTAWWLATPRDGTHAQATVPIDTAAVVRTTLTTSTQLSGTLGYSGSYALTPQLTGTITALPTPGTMIRRGQRAYEVNGDGVYLFYGTRPAWRPFAIGMTPGPDVLELEQNLTALGLDNGLALDDTFTWATEQAVRDWQSATDQTVTGTVELGRIAFAPTALRIVTDNASSVGSSSRGNPSSRPPRPTRSSPCRCPPRRPTSCIAATASP
jgi:hypothetical protein